ncbi:MAG: hypothetical protein IPK81_18030 [Rhodospirillales bacterium]|nr:MAG: hypothetical protein IPK81_18030 [Rhodospirillales bacterium]
MRRLKLLAVAACVASTAGGAVAQAPRFCVAAAAHAGWGIGVVETVEVRAGARPATYIRCEWASGALKAPAGTEMLFQIVCPAGERLAAPGFSVGAMSQGAVTPVASLGVPRADEADEAQSAFLVGTAAVGRPMQIFTTAYCRL